MESSEDIDIEGALEKLFEEACSSLVFVLDQVVVDGMEIDVQVGLDVPDEVGDAIQVHDFVKKPIKSFLTRARKGLPDYKIGVSLFVENLAESHADAWRRLEIALVQQGKAKETFDELAKLRTRK